MFAQCPDSTQLKQVSPPLIDSLVALKSRLLLIACDYWSCRCIVPLEDVTCSIRQQ
jgi:hypothetical protein